MTQGKTVRVNKVIKDFNVSLKTIVDFLAKTGHEIESSPNAKLTEEMYDLICREFQGDKSIKEQSQKKGLDFESKTTITIEQSQPQAPAKKEAEQEELLIKGVQFAPPVKEDVPAPVVVPEEPPVIAEEKQEETTDTIKVLGKIDLSTLNTKTRPAKKSKEEKVAEKQTKQIEEQPAEETVPVVENEIAPQEEEVAVVEVVADEPIASIVLDDEPVIEHIKTEFQKLDGPTILGKMNLPEERKKEAAPKRPSEADLKDKKKRKRIKKQMPQSVSSLESTPSAPKPTFTKDKKGKKKIEKAEISQEEIERQIKETMAKMGTVAKSKASKYRRDKRDAVQTQRQKEMELSEQEKSVLQVTEFVTANELATMMNVSVTEVISACMSLGLFVSINQRLDAETISIVSEEFGYQVKFITVDMQSDIVEEEDKEEDLLPRAPIVTVMGHVDHGKTSLLDYIRKANVIAGEAGGITQHIGAYEVTLETGKRIVFLDTPGHEAFTAMRARGAKVTDIAVIIIAADDNVMPQTKEAINHAQAAGVPMVFAINKIDKPGANPERIKQELAEMNLLVEDWGGKFQCQEIAAKSGLNVELLLEKILLEAEMLDLKANPNKLAKGTVIESSLDKGRGYVSKILVQEGTLHVGDVVLAGCVFGKVKAMYDERNKPIQKAGPATPLLLLGLNGASQAGDVFNALKDEQDAKDIATKRVQLQREQGLRTKKHITLDEIGRRIAIGDFKELNVIVKGDVDGSVEALSDSLLKLSNEQVQVNVIMKGVGQITESDVMLASASDAVIIGFQVRPALSARKLAETEQIDIRLYSVIYNAIEELKAAIEGMLKPDIEEKVVCNIEVREVFKITKVGTIAGCFMLDGKIERKTKIRLIRDGIVVYTGLLASLKRFKDDVKEVRAGQDCGLSITNFNDIKVGDIIEGYEETEVKRVL